jgi:phosphoenolpyruvate synthase/pyruvate phosphate dikinase
LLLADIIHEYTYLRTDRLDQWKKTQAELRHVFDCIASMLAKSSNRPWTRTDVAYCLNDEILDFLQKSKIPNFEQVHARCSNKYVYFYEDGIPKIISDEHLVEQVKKTIEQQEASNTLIRGTIALKGVVQGRVVKVHGKGDLIKVKDGDILVAKVTMPDYSPAMKVAAAFVTEEGGITSHAAIIARELKKPCIVGTGNCMRMLNEGDLVEVDANNGIVRKLNS